MRVESFLDSRNAIDMFAEFSTNSQESLLFWGRVSDRWSAPGLAKFLLGAYFQIGAPIPGQPNQCDASALYCVSSSNDWSASTKIVTLGSEGAAPWGVKAKDLALTVPRLISEARLRSRSPSSQSRAKLCPPQTSSQCRSVALAGAGTSGRLAIPSLCAR